MPGYANEYGEPIMSGVDYMREGYYADEYDVDDFYERGYDDEPEPEAPETCTHGDGSYPEGAGFECDRCESLLLGPRMEREDERGWVTWPVFFVNGWE